MSPRGKPPEKRTRYELGFDYCERGFKSGSIPLAPPRGEQPADLVERRVGTEDRPSCAVCPWPINDPIPQKGQRPKLVEYVYKDRTVSFHGDCEEAWLSASHKWRKHDA